MALFMGVAAVHVKKNQGLTFLRTGDRLEAALSRSPVHLPPSAFSGGFCIRVYEALHDVLSNAMMYSHKPHYFAQCP